MIYFCQGNSVLSWFARWSDITGSDHNNPSPNTHTHITSHRIFNYFYTYDAKGNPDESTYPSGFTIKNKYKPDKGPVIKVIDKSKVLPLVQQQVQ